MNQEQVDAFWASEIEGNGRWGRDLAGLTRSQRLVLRDYFGWLTPVEAETVMKLWHSECPKADRDRVPTVEELRTMRRRMGPRTPATPAAPARPPTVLERWEGRVAARLIRGTLDRKPEVAFLSYVEAAARAAWSKPTAPREAEAERAIRAASEAQVGEADARALLERAIAAVSGREELPLERWIVDEVLGDGVLAEALGTVERPQELAAREGAA